MFGYRYHCAVSCLPGGYVLPREVDIRAASIKDAQVFKEQLATNLPEQTLLALGDRGYDEQGCYELCDAQEVSLLAPITVKDNTPANRRERARLFHSPQAQEVYALRKTTVEPFQGYLKHLFGLEYLPVKGLLNVRALCSLFQFARAT